MLSLGYAADLQVRSASWYVRVEAFIRDRAHRRQPAGSTGSRSIIKDGRFGKWLEGAIATGTSRATVYWGNPLPIWRNEDDRQRPSASAHIDELAGATPEFRVDDLHTVSIVDPTVVVSIAYRPKSAAANAIPEVLDCWFESGSMPYGQATLPVRRQGGVRLPAFPPTSSAEALDQTRGWFYTLTVLAAAIYDKPAFRNVIVNGMVMAEDGKKMSKRLRNYTPPDELMERYGADALRLYLINSGLVRGEEQRFADAGVRDMTRRALLPWYNAFSFLRTYAAIDQWAPEKGLHFGDNVLDQWMLSRLQTLKANIAEEMEGYRLYNVVPQLFDFIENLTNWYIRFEPLALLG